MGFTFLNFFSSSLMTTVSSSLNVRIIIRTTTHGFGGCTLHLGDIIYMDQYVGGAPWSFQPVLIVLPTGPWGRFFLF